MQLTNGVVHASEYAFRQDNNGEIRRDDHGIPRRYPAWGDGAVPRGSASLNHPPIPVFAQHGALAKGREARRTVADFLLEDDHLGPDPAEDGIGLSLPDYVTPDTPWQCLVAGTDDPAQVDCTITATTGDWQANIDLETVADDTLGARIILPQPGLYRVTAKDAHGPALTQLVFAGPDQQDPIGD
ncbi:hypothetical protein AB0D30_33475 [Streptomyces sp. NPDC048409]|uniref:hypothetical protein n=1 Tax=Streptomyces sp. NPDC048409 TaxID=3154723 RepID=UPI003417633B